MYGVGTGIESGMGIGASVTTTMTGGSLVEELDSLDDCLLLEESFMSSTVIITTATMTMSNTQPKNE